MSMHYKKVRLYQLARKWDWDPKRLVELCRQSGMQSCNLLAVLDLEQQRELESLLRMDDEQEPPPV
jgi:hypothetical protein